MADGGVPVLEGSIAFFACQVIGAHVYGDHTVYLGAVKELYEGDDGTPLLFYRSKWHTPAD
jgi:flavin reductase (DIM6/NTAB) family NADH-FMN oxidoreductase RutF